ncbi:MAG TPA: hypothetical protein DDW52_24020 [Planctomycetaceae bacterium]|nr:hypothetical protein [Planctomycetaceae bacterium]
MGDINIANPKGRDAVVALESVISSEPVRWIDSSGRQAASARFVKATLDHGIDQLIAKHGALQKVGQAIIEGDPEIDLDHTGRQLRETARVVVDQNGQIVRNVRFFEIIKEPDGSQRERRPRELAEQNISSDTPLKWTGVFIPKSQAVRKFVFAGKAQLQHVNGLTYDFLFAMAKDLEERRALMLLGAGPNSKQPLVLRRGGTPYRGFLEGRTDGDRYCLLLHFSNLELKTAPKTEKPDDKIQPEAKPKTQKSTGRSANKANNGEEPVVSTTTADASPTKKKAALTKKKAAPKKKTTATKKTTTAKTTKKKAAAKKTGDTKTPPKKAAKKKPAADKAKVAKTVPKRQTKKS